MSPLLSFFLRVRQKSLSNMVCETVLCKDDVSCPPFKGLSAGSQQFNLTKGVIVCRPISFTWDVT